ncbi:MAG: hypothetical protein HY869_21865 [Chloroflexi bacterium]|nr:hypothetical protein [Chloroflexota bacterium]
MENKTYRYDKNGRFLFSVFFVLFLAYMGMTLFSLVSPGDLLLRFSVGDYPNAVGVMGFLFLAGLLLLEGWFVMGMGLFSLKYRITLADTGIQIQSVDFWGRKFLNSLNNSYSIGQLSYDDIMFIDADSGRPGIAKLTFKDGRHILLAVRSLENHPDFVEQLAGKLDVMQIGQGFLKLSQPRRFKVILPFVYILAFLPTVVLYFSMTLDHWSPRAWNEELGLWSVDGISRDSDGTVWASVSKFNDDDVYVWRLSGDSREHWTLPSDTCADCEAYTVSHDSRGFPRILDNEASSTDNPESTSIIYAWEGQNWIKTDPGFSFETITFPERLFGAGTRVWGNRNGTLAYVDFESNTFGEFPSPAEVISRKLELRDFRINPDNSLLVWFSEKDMPVLLYRLEDGAWEKIVELPLSNQRARDYCQDFHGKVWALTEDLVTHQPGVGFYDEQSDVWTWADLKLGQYDRILSYLPSMGIDANDRIWVSGVYEPRDEKDRHLEFVNASAWNDGAIEPIVEYTEENSNVRRADFFIMTKERIWISSSQLYWIDYEELPSPLPDWAVWIKDFHGDYFGQYLLMTVGSFFLLIVAFIMEKY